MQSYKLLSPLRLQGVLNGVATTYYFFLSADDARSIVSTHQCMTEYQSPPFGFPKSFTLPTTFLLIDSKVHFEALSNLKYEDLLAFLKKTRMKKDNLHSFGSLSFNSAHINLYSRKFFLIHSPYNLEKQTCKTLYFLRYHITCGNAKTEIPHSLHGPLNPSNSRGLSRPLADKESKRQVVIWGLRDL